jgi:hypothetical protein
MIKKIHHGQKDSGRIICGKPFIDPADLEEDPDATKIDEAYLQACAKNVSHEDECTFEYVDPEYLRFIHEQNEKH